MWLFQTHLVEIFIFIGFQNEKFVSDLNYSGERYYDSNYVGFILYALYHLHRIFSFKYFIF